MCFIQSLSSSLAFLWLSIDSEQWLQTHWSYHLTRLFTWGWTVFPASRMLHLKSCTSDRTTHTSHKLKRIKALWCSTTAVQIVRETTNCYVRSHLLWSKIRLHYSTFFPSLLPYVRAAFCGMGLSLCSVLEESDKYCEKQTPIVSARHDIDIGLTSNGQRWSYKSICLYIAFFIVMLLYGMCCRMLSWV